MSSSSSVPQHSSTSISYQRDPNGKRHKINIEKLLAQNSVRKTIKVYKEICSSAPPSESGPDSKYVIAEKRIFEHIDSRLDAREASVERKLSSWKTVGLSLLTLGAYYVFLRVKKTRINKKSQDVVREHSSFLQKHHKGTENNTYRIRTLINEYEKHGEDWKDDFPFVSEISSDRLRPKEVIDDCFSAFSEIEEKQKFKVEKDNQIILEKVIVPPDSEVITIGDLHGDAYSLVQIIKKLCDEGKLDKNYQIKEGVNVQIVFLGDYVDRGPDSWAVLNILSRLKLNNMKNVHLIRGNHENLKQIVFQGRRYGKWLDDKSRDERIKLDNFFKHLPHAVFLGSESSAGNTEYDIYTHGGIPISFNFNTLHEKRNGLHKVSKSLLENSFSYKKNLSNEASLLERRVNRFVKKYQFPQKSSFSTGDEWNWADLTMNTKGSSIHSNRGVNIAIADLVAWMEYNAKISRQSPDTLISYQESYGGFTIRRLFKGHSHKKGLITRSGKEFYFLDSDLYNRKPSDIHIHKMCSKRPIRTVFRRNFSRKYWEEAELDLPLR